MLRGSPPASSGMFDPFLLSRFLVIAHAVGVTGLGAWYLGLIPRGTPERRFLPLGLYMTTGLIGGLVTWLAFYYPALEPALDWLRPFMLVLAAGLMASAFYLHHMHRPIPETWPGRVRASLVLHGVFAFVIPALQAGPVHDADRILPASLALCALVWIVASSLSGLKRQGHFLHWSMAIAVLGCLTLGWFATARVREQGLRSRDDDLRSRIDAFAELIDARLFATAADDQSPSPQLVAALESMCSTSAPVTGAFLLTPGANPRFIARVRSPLKDPVPVMASAATYARFAGGSQPLIHRFTDLEDGERWHLALAPVRRFEDQRVVALLGLLAPQRLLDATLADSMFVTDAIVFLVALVVYGCIAGYLQGLVRVWQRDTLLEINAEHSRQLLQTTAPHEVALWLVRKMQQRLNLVHCSFWIYSERNGVTGYRTLAAEPSHTARGAGQWHALSELPPPWLSALSRGQNIEGDVRELGSPWPGMVPGSFATPWVFVENVDLHGRPYGSIVAVFPDHNLIARGEIRSALRSIANAFASCLVREERSDHLAAAEERLRTIIETSPDGFWDADYTHDEWYRSDRWWQMLGHDIPDDPSDREAYEALIEPDDLELLRGDAVEPLPPGRKFRRREYRARHRDGSWRWIESNTVELRTVHGPAERALGFDRDVTHRHHYEERLREAAESAARANRAKSEFLATMNHELRTPLNSVIGFATILDRSPLNPSQRDWVTSMRTSAEQLLGLISDVLDFSRIEAGRLELELASFELRRATEQALEHFSRLATEKEIALHFEFEDRGQPSWVVGDTLRLRQILTNLVGNALKFTQRGFVRLVTRPLDDERWEFAVEDTGPGIPPDKINSLFSRFSQLDASSTRAHGGTGLGLAISRELARAMGGDISVTSTLGEGSIFTVVVRLPVAQGERRRYTDHEVSLGITLPVFQPDEHDLSALTNALANTATTLLRCETVANILAFAKGRKSAATVVFPRAYRTEAIEAARRLPEFLTREHGPLILLGIQAVPPDLHQPSPFSTELSAPLRRRDLINLIDLNRHRELRPTPAAKAQSIPPFADANRVRVLVAEDHPVNREVIRTMLEQLGIAADFAVNGRAAIDLLAAHPYDIALVDIQMPVVDGFGVARWVRREWTPAWPRPKLIAVTANATHGDRERCIQAGMDEYVAKPVTFTTLSEIIRQASPSGLELARESKRTTMPPPPSPPSSPAPAGPGDHLVDWVNFDSILAFTAAAENPEVLQRIIRTYQTDRDELLVRIQLMTAEQRAEERNLLHKLKGSTGSLALMGVVETIKKLHDPEEPLPADEREQLLVQIREESATAIAAVYARYPWLNDGQS